MSFLGALRKRSRFLTAISAVLCLSFVIPVGNLQATPPLRTELVDASTLRLVWPDTGDKVTVQESADLGLADPWTDFMTVPTLENGFFLQNIPLNGGSQFFRLTDEEIDPNAPVFNNPPAANQTFFPGQTIQFRLSAAADDGGSVDFLAEPLPLPAGATLNILTGEFKWTPTVEQVGITTITFLAVDGMTSTKLPIRFDIQSPPIGGVTSLSGLLLDTNAFTNDGSELPVVGARVSVLKSTAEVFTGADGTFTLTGIPDGLVVLDIDTRPAENAPNGAAYAGFREALKIVGGISNMIERPIYMPRLAMDSLTPVDPNFTTVVTNEDLGISITVPPHTAMLDGEEFTGELSISNVPDALAPAALPDNLGFGVLVTIQPVGVRFNQPVPITFPNTENLAPGNETDIWSLDPDRGVFAVVGTGRVSDDGSVIETIEGGVRAADWHGTGPPSPPPSGGPPPPPLPPGDPGPPPCSGASGGGGAGGAGGPGSGGGAGGSGSGGGAGGPSPTGGAGGSFGSTVSLADGAIMTSISLPPYGSGTQERSLELGYHSITASPRILAPVETTVDVRMAVPRRISMSGSFGGIGGNEPVFYDTSSLNENVDETIAGGIVFDARGLPTGIANFTVNVTSHYPRSAFSAETSDLASVVNQRDSAIGAGWDLIGLQHIYSPPQNENLLLLVSGDGSSMLFQDGVVSSSFTLTSLGSDRAADYSFTEGSIFSQARSAIQQSFPNAGFKNVENLAEASDDDLLVLSLYASATEGAPLSVSEQSSLQSFVRGGGSALIFLDHDLERASFSQARASLLQPFGLSGSNIAELGGPIPSLTIPSSSFPLVDRLDMPSGGFELDTVGTDLEVLLEGSVPDSARLAILPEGALGEGSGPVVFVADTQAFTDNATFGFNSDASRRNLLLGSLEFFLRSGRDPDAPVEFLGPAGEFSRIVKEGDGRFERLMPDGARHFFNASGRLIETQSRDGEIASYDHDGAGNLTRITDPFGRQTQLTYTDGKLSQVSDPAGRTTLLQHDEFGNLVEVRLPNGATTRYEYDDEHLMTAEINAVGGRTERQYDQWGRALSVTLPDGTTRSAENPQSISVELGNTAGTDADPAPFKRPAELVASMTDEAGNRDEFQIGPAGTASQITDPAGRSVELARDANGNLLSRREPTGRKVDSTYDLDGRLLSITDNAIGSIYSLSYDAKLGALVAVENGQGQTALLNYDDAGRLEELVSLGGRRITYAYEGQSTLPGSATLPSGQMITFEHDANGNLESTSYGDATTAYTYNAAGQVASVTDAEGGLFRYQYDGGVDLSAIEFPGGQMVEYARDPRGLIAKITVPSGAEYDLDYDARGRFESFTSPISDAMSFENEYTDGQLSRLVWGDNSEISFGYTDGDLMSFTSEEGRATLTYDDTTGLVNRFVTPGNVQADFTYDGSGRLTGLTWSGAINGTVNRTYDNQGRVASFAVNGAAALARTFDADGLMTGSGPMVITRDADSGLVTSTTLGNCTDTRGYNESDDLTSYTVRYDGAPVYSLTMTRDNLGRVLTKDETIEGVMTRVQFDYTPSGFLSRETRDGIVVIYTYDDNGNRLTRSVAGGPVETGAYNSADQLTSYAGTTHSYDGRGRLSERGGDTFSYNISGGLQAVGLDGGPDLNYLHPVGERRFAERRNGAIQRQFLYRDELTLAAELDASGNTRSIFGDSLSGGAPEYLLRDGRTYRIISDDLGSPRLVIDCESGTIIQKMRHDAFGRVLEDSAPRFQPFGFGGGIYDPDTGLVRFGARDYDGFTGRWTAPDPALFDGSAFNLYQFAAGDPVNFVDRNGREPNRPSGGGAGGTGGCPVPETPQVILDRLTFLSLEGNDRGNFIANLPRDRQRAYLRATTDGVFHTPGLRSPRRGPVSVAPSLGNNSLGTPAIR